MWLEKKRKAGMNYPKIGACRVKIVKYLVRIIFIPLDAFIICKMNEKPGKMYQKMPYYIFSCSVLW